MLVRLNHTDVLDNGWRFWHEGRDSIRAQRGCGGGWVAGYWLWTSWFEARVGTECGRQVHEPGDEGKMGVC